MTELAPAASSVSAGYFAVAETMSLLLGGDWQKAFAGVFIKIEIAINSVACGVTLKSF